MGPMYIISRERGLEQWRAINDLSEERYYRCHQRVEAEQPDLMRFIASSAFQDAKGGLPLGPDGAVVPDDPRLFEVAALLETVSALVELFEREGGSKLKAITGPEVEARLEAIFNSAKKDEGKRSNGRRGSSPLETSCRQSEVLAGSFVSYLAILGREKQMPIYSLPLLRLAVDCLDAAEPDASAPFWTADRVEDVLSVAGCPLRGEALQRADDFRDALTPRFLAELEQCIEGGDDYFKQEEETLVSHALYLMAKWRERAVLPVFRRFLSMLAEQDFGIVENLSFGVTEGGGVLLASFSGGRIEEIQSLFEDEALDDSHRDAVLDAMATLVSWGALPRATLVDYLRTLMSGRLKSPASSFVWSSVANMVCTLEAWELLPDAEALFERGLIEEADMDRTSLADARAGKFGSLWEAFVETHKPIADIEAATEWLDEPVVFAAESDDVFSRSLALGGSTDSIEPPSPYLAAQPYVAPAKVGRNDPCPCGSGKKFKRCCAQ